MLIDKNVTISIILTYIYIEHFFLVSHHKKCNVEPNWNYDIRMLSSNQYEYSIPGKHSHTTQEISNYPN